MLKGKLLHPEILGVLGTLGHGSKVLIADGNYPVGTKLAPTASAVYLNLSPGIPTVTQVLDAILDYIPVEAAEVMMPADGKEPPIFSEFRQFLGKTDCKGKLEALERFTFYDAASAPDVGLSIHTGEQRIYANLRLTIGVVR
jgi:L-fucose mutarotase